MEAPPILPKKKDVLEALLGESNVFLHLDPRREGVVVPKWFQNQPELVLQLGLRMPVPIPDLEIDDEGVSCTLSFNRSPFWCCVPWRAIFAVVSEKDQRGVLWPEDVPPDGRSMRALKPAPRRPKLTALGPNDRLEDESPAPSSASAPTDEATAASASALPEIGPDSKCANCGTRWVEDQTSCPVCGASMAEGLAPLENKSLPAESSPHAMSSSPEAVSSSPVAAADETAEPPSELSAAAKKRGPSSKRGETETNGERAPASSGPRPPGGSKATLPTRPRGRLKAAPSSPPSQPKPPPAPVSSHAPEEPPPSSDPPAKKREKRELPPYLRVVK
jgi:hypothetical protein